MPVAGRPRNPLLETPDRFRERAYVDVPRVGETPGLQTVESRGKLVGEGTIRRVWRQSVNFIPAPPAYSWTQHPALVTRSLRYRATSLYRAAGNDNTRYGARRPIVTPRHNQPTPTIGAGQKQNRPSRRNRLTSFGSRVPLINPPSPAATDRNG